MSSRRDESTSALRVLVCAPIGRDAHVCSELLRRTGLDTKVCDGIAALHENLEAGAAAVLVAEEALFGKDLSRLCAWVSQQAAWSDLPFIVLTGTLGRAAIIAWRHSLTESLGNVSFLERPVQAITLTSAVRAAVRARARQEEVRMLLRARDHAAAELENLVRARTHELEQANDELRTQIAERTQIEASLRQAQKIEALGQLTGGVAHDFNNLLMVISGGIDMLGRAKDAPRRELLVDGMRQAAQRGAALTRQLLAFSRRQALQPQSVNLARQIGAMRELLDRSLRADIQIDCEFAADLWPVHVDPGELELVILNLAVNARDAIPSHGTIIIRAENLSGHHGEISGECVRLSVIDSGTGMTPEVRQHVFEPFFTTKEIGKGSGLGLAQVYGFARQSGGSVEIHSEVGHGTSVMLYLPRASFPPAEDAAAPVETPVEQRNPESARCVLLVEDNEEVAALVRAMLDELGYEVIRVGTAQAALGALANDRRVDVVLSDIMMPGEMDGLDLAREIRSRRNGLPVVLTSGYAQASINEAEAEGWQVLGKPFSLEELSTALRAAVEAMPLGSGLRRHEAQPFIIESLRDSR